MISRRLLEMGPRAIYSMSLESLSRCIGFVDVLACSEKPFSEQHLFLFISGVSSSYPNPEPIFVTYLPEFGPKAIFPAIDDAVA